MSHSVDDTIVAIATPPGGSLRGVVRLSGPATLHCLRLCFQPAKDVELPQLVGARVVPGTLLVGEPIRTIPVELYVWPNKKSYTRQVSAEIHTVGSPPVLDAVLQAICEHGARLARPGEFTMRAFLAGRIDLTQAEAVLGVIDAQDTRSLGVALSQLAGGLATPLAVLRSDLLDLLADIEAGLDFVDEDIEFVERGHVESRLGAAGRDTQELLTQIAARAQTSFEPRVVFRGYSNVGKSSLVNALARHVVAIVSQTAGTTRDYVTQPFCWSGISGTLVDTAGLEQDKSLDDVSRRAQQVAESQTASAELELFCLDASRPLNSVELRVLQEGVNHRRLVVWTKVDDCLDRPIAGTDTVLTSSHTGEGIERLRESICHRLTTATNQETAVVMATAARCRESLAAASQSLARAKQLVVAAEGDELVAIELRDALEHLGHVVGAVYTEDILDRVFGRFCIGK